MASFNLFTFIRGLAESDPKRKPLCTRLYFTQPAELPANYLNFNIFFVEVAMIAFNYTKPHANYK